MVVAITPQYGWKAAVVGQLPALPGWFVLTPIHDGDVPVELRREPVIGWVVESSIKDQECAEWESFTYPIVGPEGSPLIGVWLLQRPDGSITAPYEGDLTDEKTALAYFAEAEEKQRQREKEWERRKALR